MKGLEKILILSFGSMSGMVVFSGIFNVEHFYTSLCSWLFSFCLLSAILYGKKE